MIRRALVALLVLLASFAVVACEEDVDQASTCRDDASAPRVLVLGDSNLVESSEQVEDALADAGSVPTLESFPGLGLKDLDGYWLPKLPALLDVDPDVVVVALGTNDTTSEDEVDAFPERLDSMMAALGERPVVWLTHVDPRPAQVPDGAATVNAAIRTAPDRWPNLTVVDRTPILISNPSLVRDDDLHFTAKGMLAFARAIRDGASRALPEVVTVACGKAR